MESVSSNPMGDLVNKFKQATLELGDTNEVEVINSEITQGGEEDNNWEASAIGKVIIEVKMSYESVDKFIKFTWPFLTEKDIKIIKVDPNIMIFKFNKWDSLNRVINEIPWSINMHLLVVHDYIPEMVYTEKHWGFQQFWIQLKFILPEHTNVAAVTKIGSIMGEVIAIEPKDVVPVGGVPVRVCVNIDLTNPMRRGVKAITNAGFSRCIKFFYERQPASICSECYVIKHSKVACKDASNFLAKAHEKPYFFGNPNMIRKNISTVSTNVAPAIKNSQKKFTKSVVFVPPKDGEVINMNFLLKKDEGEGDSEDVRLGKRSRVSEKTTIVVNVAEDNSHVPKMFKLLN